MWQKFAIIKHCVNETSRKLNPALMKRLNVPNNMYDNILQITDCNVIQSINVVLVVLSVTQTCKYIWLFSDLSSWKCYFRISVINCVILVKFSQNFTQHSFLYPSTQKLYQFLKISQNNKVSFVKDVFHCFLNNGNNGIQILLCFS